MNGTEDVTGVLKHVINQTYIIVGLPLTSGYPRKGQRYTLLLDRGLIKGWVRLKGQVAPHCVPWFKNYIMAYKRLCTSLGSKTLNTSLGLGEPQFKTQL